MMLQSCSDKTVRSEISCAEAINITPAPLRGPYDYGRHKRRVSLRSTLRAPALVALSYAPRPRWGRSNHRGYTPWLLPGPFLSDSHVARFVAFGFLLLSAFSTGCGYTTKRPFSDDIRTIHVEMMQSKEFRRELEFRLTESLVKRIEMDTPYRIAPKASADALLTGEILNVDNRTFGNDFQTDLPREIGSTVVVRFRVQDLRSGDLVVDRPRFVYQTSYIPPVGEEFSDAMTRAMDGLAQQMVETMESAW